MFVIFEDFRTPRAGPRFSPVKVECQRLGDLGLCLVTFYKYRGMTNDGTRQWDLNVGIVHNNKPPIFNGLYYPFMVIRGMVYYCYTNITVHCLRPVVDWGTSAKFLLYNTSV